jgi:transcriptional regulator with XRE-family HTH domain
MVLQDIPDDQYAEFLRNMDKTKKTPNPIDKHVGKRLRMQRRRLGMSQRALGTALGLKFQQIQNYEKGTNRIGSSRLHQVAAVGAPKLHSGRLSRSVTASPMPLIHFLATPDGIALARAFMRIDMKVRRQIVALLQTLTEAR